MFSVVDAVAGDGLVVEIRRIPAQLGGQFSTQTLVVVATGHLLAVLADLGVAAPTQHVGQPAREGVIASCRGGLSEGVPVEGIR